MPRFDTTAAFDAQLRFDQEATPVITRKPKHIKIMSKFKLELQKKNIAQKLEMGVTHTTSMAGNTNYPVATRVPTDAQFATTQSELDTANADVAAAETVWKQKIVVRNDKEAAWDTSITARAANCESVTPNNLAALASTGLPLRSAPTPIGDMPAPSNFRATMGDMNGEIDLQWDAIYGASIYVIECKEHGSVTPWEQIKSQQQSKYTATGLVSGKTYAFRVRALGPKGEGPWSDETVKMAP